MDCVFLGAKIITNHEIDRDALVSFSTKFLEEEDPAWGPVYEKAFDTCIANFKEHKQDKTLKETNCNPMSLIFMLCIFNDTFQNCPAHLWTSSKILNIYNIMRDCRL